MLSVTETVVGPAPTKSCLYTIRLSRSGWLEIPLSITATAMPLPVQPDLQAVLALTASEVRSSIPLTLRFGEICTTSGSLASNPIDPAGTE